MVIAHRLVSEAYSSSSGNHEAAQQALANHLVWFAKALHIISGFNNRLVARRLRSLADLYEPIFSAEDAAKLLDDTLKKP